MPINSFFKNKVQNPFLTGQNQKRVDSCCMIFKAVPLFFHKIIQNRILYKLSGRQIQNRHSPSVRHHQFIVFCHHVLDPLGEFYPFLARAAFPVDLIYFSAQGRPEQPSVIGKNKAVYIFLILIRNFYFLKGTIRRYQPVTRMSGKIHRRHVDSFLFPGSWIFSAIRVISLRFPGSRIFSAIRAISLRFPSGRIIFVLFPSSRIFSVLFPSGRIVSALSRIFCLINNRRITILRHSDIQQPVGCIQLRIPCQFFFLPGSPIVPGYPFPASF